ncbi:hypothetical protein DE146DRAFT_618974 [Phaeosphaeria sp. MPI-PUGE-AT-0046c]|nr:hypothetical protein DE146DRAFT_618974 [Phaeosphaeria sp. MPI-PUGE-AT-0046c]
MSPTCSKAAMRVLISVLLASSVANAAALPHQVLDARAPAAIQNAELAAEAIQAAASAAAEDPTNFFENISDELNDRTAWEVFRDFFTRLFGPRDGDDDAQSTVTVTVTPATPETTTTTVEASASAEASISLDIIIPPGHSSVPTEVISDITPTSAAPTNEVVFSILPIGDLSTSINATELTPIFITAPASDIPVPTASVIEIIPPFPVDNGTTTDVLLPTAVPITGQFSVMIPLVTDIPKSATANATEPAETLVGPGLNASAPLGTGIPLVTGVPVIVNLTTPVETLVGPLETDLPVPANVTVPSGTGVVALPPTPANSSAPAGTGFAFLVPISNGTKLPLNTTAALNETASSTTLVVITEVVTPVPVTVTDDLSNELSSLRQICQDPKIHTLTLPIIARFYGSYAYPSLHRFPGCTIPNERQSVQAPGLLNCSALGEEVQNCQALGTKVLISIKGADVGSVGGNVDFGDPNVGKHPFGQAFAIAEGIPSIIADLPTVPTGSDFPNLFDEAHPPSAFALTLFSLFGEGHTERADLRPLGPDRPLGEEVVVDGFDVQVPAEWKGKYQDKKFKDLVRRLKELHQEAWKESGGLVGGPADLGADGKGVVYEGYVGGSLKVRSVGLEVRAELKRVGWAEWNPLAE